MAASTRLRCYTPQGGASPLLSAEYRQTGTGSFHAWRSRATTAAVLSRAVLPRRSQLSVGCTGGSMFCDLSLAAAAAPMGVVRLAVALSCATSAANAGSGLIAPGSSQGGVPHPTALLRDVRLLVRGSSALVHVFARPGGGVRGRLLLWGSLGVSNGYGFQVPCSVRRGAPSCERAVLFLSLLACSRPGSAFRDVSQLGRTAYSIQSQYHGGG